MVVLGLWGRCVSYVRGNCVSHACQQMWYHMHAKTEFYMHAKHCVSFTLKFIFAYQCHDFSFLFVILFIRIIMRPGSNTSLTTTVVVQCGSFYNLELVWSGLKRATKKSVWALNKCTTVACVRYSFAYACDCLRTCFPNKDIIYWHAFSPN